MRYLCSISCAKDTQLLPPPFQPMAYLGKYCLMINLHGFITWYLLSNILHTFCENDWLYRVLAQWVPVILHHLLFILSSLDVTPSPNPDKQDHVLLPLATLINQRDKVGYVNLLFIRCCCWHVTQVSRALATKVSSYSWNLGRFGPKNNLKKVFYKWYLVSVHPPEPLIQMLKFHHCSMHG